MKCAALGRWKIQDAKNRQKFAICTSWHKFLELHLRKWGMYRQPENMLYNNISSTCFYNMVNLGPLTAEICLPVWGTPANFNGFRVLASLRHRRHSTEVNRTLHNIWPSPGPVHYIYIFGGSCPKRNFTRCKIHFSSKSSCVLLYLQRYCTALE